MCDLIKYIDLLNKSIDELEIEKVELSELLSKLQESYQSLSFENDLLNERLSEIANFDEQEKGEGSRIQFDLEEKLT